jgi:hypothetical protein
MWSLEDYQNEAIRKINISTVSQKIKQQYIDGIKYKADVDAIEDYFFEFTTYNFLYNDGFNIEIIDKPIAGQGDFTATRDQISLNVEASLMRVEDMFVNRLEEYNDIVFDIVLVQNRQELERSKRSFYNKVQDKRHQLKNNMYNVLVIGLKNQSIEHDDEIYETIYGHRLQSKGFGTSFGGNIYFNNIPYNQYIAYSEPILNDDGKPTNKRIWSDRNTSISAIVVIPSCLSEMFTMVPLDKIFGKTLKETISINPLTKRYQFSHPEFEKCFPPYIEGVDFNEWLKALDKQLYEWGLLWRQSKTIPFDGFKEFSTKTD